MEIFDKDTEYDPVVAEHIPTEPVWNWKLALAILAVFAGGVMLMLMVQTRLFAMWRGEGLIDDIGTEVTPAISLTNLIGMSVAGIGSIWLVMIVWRKRTWSDLGFKLLSSRWLWSSVWLAIALILVRILIGTLLAVLYPSLAEGMEEVLFSADNNLLTNLILLILIGIVIPIWEELFFRGFLYKWSRNRLGMWAAISLNALLFGIVHMIPLQMLLAAMMAFALAWIYERSNSLWAPILMHMINNLAIGISTIWLIHTGYVVM